MKLVEVAAAKEYANTVLGDPFLKMAVNSVLDHAPGVELVRCKDCKRVYRDEYSHCYFCEEKHVNSEHFCSYGERLTNEI